MANYTEISLTCNDSVKFRRLLKDNNLSTYPD
ncbi:unnamed protein product, partial [marine sediment metagenome]